MKMPIFVWSVCYEYGIGDFCIPVLTATLAMLGLDRLLGMHFFTADMGGNPMMYVNLIWAWGIPKCIFWYCRHLVSLQLFQYLAVKNCSATNMILALYRHYDSVIYRLAAPLLYDGCWCECQRILWHYDNGDCCANWRQSIQLDIYDVPWTGQFPDADAMVYGICRNVYDRWSHGRVDGRTGHRFCCSVVCSLLHISTI